MEHVYRQRVAYLQHGRCGGSGILKKHQMFRAIVEAGVLRELVIKVRLKVGVVRRRYPWNEGVITYHHGCDAIDLEIPLVRDELPGHGISIRTSLIGGRMSIRRVNPTVVEVIAQRRGLLPEGVLRLEGTNSQRDGKDHEKNDFFHNKSELIIILCFLFFSTFYREWYLLYVFFF